MVRCGAAEARSREDQRRAEVTPWHRVGERRRRRREAARSRELADQLQRDLPEGALAEHIHAAWHTMALTQYPHQNPLRPALAASWQNQLDEIAAAARARPLRSRQYWARERRPDQIPGLVEHLTPDAVRETLSGAVQQLAQIAADDRFLVAQVDGDDGATVTFVQHQASGLRAMFTVGLDTASFGTVQSKPYRIGSIDPANPGTCLTWERHIGLGIGTRIYRHAADLLPHVRWPNGSTTAYSGAVRRKLHSEQPYVWQHSSRAPGATHIFAAGGWPRRRTLPPTHDPRPLILTVGLRGLRRADYMVNGSVLGGSRLRLRR